jgi:hypothetical protein
MHCFQKPEKLINSFRKRLEKPASELADRLIAESINNISTGLYDDYQ